MGNFGGFGFPNQSIGGTSNNYTAPNNSLPNLNQSGGMMGNPFFPMMGSGFEANQGMNFSNRSNPFNPFLSSNPLVPNGNLSQSNSFWPSQENGILPFFQNLQNVQ